MKDYNPHLESRSSHKTDQPEGVSEANKEKNRGWGHRTQVARNRHEKKRAESISRVYEERIDGELLSLEQVKRKEQKQAENHGESHENDYRFGRPLTKKERAARKFGEYWPDEKKRDFLANDTDLNAAQLGWE